VFFCSLPFEQMMIFAKPNITSLIARTVFPYHCPKIFAVVFVVDVGEFVDNYGVDDFNWRHY